MQDFQGKKAINNSLSSFTPFQGNEAPPLEGWNILHRLFKYLRKSYI